MRGALFELRSEAGEHLAKGGDEQIVKGHEAAPDCGIGLIAAPIMGISIAMRQIAIPYRRTAALRRLSFVPVGSAGQ